MYPSTTWLSFAILILISQVISPAYKPLKCTSYSGANTQAATCNGLPDIICTKGCHGSFVTAEGCKPQDGLNGLDPLTTQTCTVGFDRDTIADKVCSTRTQTFSCGGKTSGYATCYGCVKRHLKSPSKDYPPEWVNQTHPFPNPPPLQ
ncbi:hypothetical protein PGTUg99_030684 [Puccinia graminis f. sp. tritici]|uniref:Secreted protein n=1 Tax=Puccinia graminis f. sp. tritici TaxID=56615 RepID=A0A5B0NPU3_PUCGR|nr:hypothetical protein PGTUg99_030684 [Puccinia graminis f. sp. tritici]